MNSNLLLIFQKKKNVGLVNSITELYYAEQIHARPWKSL